MTATVSASPTPGYDFTSAAKLLIDARTGPRPAALPAELQPATPADAYLVQDLVVNARGEVAGWKVGAPTPEAEPFRGAITRDSLFEGRAVRLEASFFNVIGVEAELAYRFGSDLPPRDTPYTTEDVLAAITSLHAAIEVVDTRYEEWNKQDALSRLGDQASHGALIVGEGIEDFSAIVPVQQQVRLRIDGEVAAEHDGGNSAGDPIRMLVWLANQGAVSLGGIRAGQIVTTGSTTGSIFVAQGAQVIAEFPGVGTAELLLT